MSRTWKATRRCILGNHSVANSSNLGFPRRHAGQKKSKLRSPNPTYGPTQVCPASGLYGPDLTHPSIPSIFPLGRASSFRDALTSIKINDPRHIVQGRETLTRDTLSRHLSRSRGKERGGKGRWGRGGREGEKGDGKKKRRRMRSKKATK